MTSSIRLIDRDSSICKSTFGNDKLPEALEFAKKKKYTSGEFYFEQWDDEEDGYLMSVSVSEVNEAFKDGEYPSDLTFF